MEEPDFDAGVRAERRRIARALASQPSSQAIADIAELLGLSAELDDAWDELHPEDAGKPRGHAQGEVHGPG